MSSSEYPVPALYTLKSNISRATIMFAVFPPPFAGIVKPGISFVLNVEIPPVPSFA